MSGQGVGGETSKEKRLNSGNKACCSGWEGPPLSSSVYSDDSSRNGGWPPRYPSERRAGPESLIARLI